MAQFFPGQQPPYGGGAAQNLQFYPSTYSGTPVSGHTTPSQGFSYPQAGGSAYGGFGGNAGFGQQGRMGEQDGLKMGWLAAFGTEGYTNEPPLLEELGVNWGHIVQKVWSERRQANDRLWQFSILCDR
jgi:hypothetical protein